jgi:hypothetical protein
VHNYDFMPHVSINVKDIEQNILCTNEGIKKFYSLQKNGTIRHCNVLMPFAVHIIIKISLATWCPSINTALFNHYFINETFSQ